MAFGALIQTVGANAYPATGVTVNISTAVLGNLLVAFHFTGDANSTTPSGFAEAVAIADGGNSDEMAIYYKISDGTEVSVVFTSGSSELVR